MSKEQGIKFYDFIELNKSIRNSLVKLIEGEDLFECIPMQGSGTFAVEAMIGSLTQTKSKILILINGAYGQRMKEICKYHNRSYITYEVAEHEIHDLLKIENGFKNRI